MFSVSVDILVSGPICFLVLGVFAFEKGEEEIQAKADLESSEVGVVYLSIVRGCDYCRQKGVPVARLRVENRRTDQKILSR